MGTMKRLFFFFLLGKGVLSAAWERGRARGPWPGGELDACSVLQPTGWMSAGQVPSLPAGKCGGRTRMGVRAKPEQGLRAARAGFKTLEDAAEVCVPEDAGCDGRRLPGKPLLQLLRSPFLPKSSWEQQSQSDRSSPCNSFLPKIGLLK